MPDGVLDSKNQKLASEHSLVLLAHGSSIGRLRLAKLPTILTHEDNRRLRPKPRTQYDKSLR